MLTSNWALGLLIDLITTKSIDIIEYWLYNLINVGCELAGYYLAAALIDHKHYGRKRMQAVGFIVSSILFIIAAGAYPHTASGSPGEQTFVYIYVSTSPQRVALPRLFAKFAKTSAVLLVLFHSIRPEQRYLSAAGEVYPARIRATARGALTSTVLYNYIPTDFKCWVICWLGLIDFCLTMALIPKTTGIDHKEQERY